MTDAPSPSALTADQVAEWLEDHPDFLNTRPDLLELLTPPELKQAEGVQDFQFFMIEKLKREAATLKEQRAEIIDNARANLTNHDRIQRAVLTLLEADSLPSLIETINHQLAGILDIDAVAMAMERSPRDSGHGADNSAIRLMEPGTVSQVIGPDADHIFFEAMPGEPALYGAGAETVQSQLILRLSISDLTPPGLLAFGSREPQGLTPQHGVEQINFLKRVIELEIRGWLRLEM
ncbi:MAG: hypothetical protein Alpg2KO_07230 [Alphaproteobacteria bacterium]